MSQSAQQMLCQLDQDTKLYLSLIQKGIQLIIKKQQTQNKKICQIESLQNYDQLNKYCQGNLKKFQQLLKNRKNVIFNNQDSTLTILKPQAEQLASIKFYEPKALKKKLQDTININTPIKNQLKNNFNIENPYKLQQFLINFFTKIIQYQELQKQQKAPQNQETQQKSLKRKQIKKKIRYKDLDDDYVIKKKKKKNYELEPERIRSTDKSSQKTYYERRSKSFSSSSNSDQRSRNKLRRSKLFVTKRFQKNEDAKFQRNMITCMVANGVSLFGKNEVHFSMMFKFTQIKEVVFVGIANDYGKKIIYGSNGIYSCNIEEEQKASMRGFKIYQEVQMFINRVEGICGIKIQKDELKKQTNDWKWVPVIILNSEGDSVLVFE